MEGMTSTSLPRPPRKRRASKGVKRSGEMSSSSRDCRERSASDQKTPKTGTFMLQSDESVRRDQKTNSHDTSSSSRNPVRTNSAEDGKPRRTTKNKSRNAELGSHGKAFSSSEVSGGSRSRKPKKKTKGRRTSTSADKPSSHDSSTLTMRPLPPLKKTTRHRPRRQGSLYPDCQESQRVLPPIGSSHFPYQNKRHVTLVGGTQNQTPNAAEIQESESVLRSGNFAPLRASTPVDSESTTTLHSLRGGRPLSKPELATFRHFPRGLGPLSKSAGTFIPPMTDARRLSGRLAEENRPRSPGSMTTSCVSTTSPSIIHLDGDIDRGRSPHRKVRTARAGEWVRSSTFACNVPNHFDFSHSTSTENLSTIISSIPIDDTREPKYRPRFQSKSFVQLKNALSNVHPPPPPFTIVVHERVSKFNIDLQFRIQQIRDWWRETKIPRPRLPKLDIHIDLSGTKEAVRRFARSIWWPVPVESERKKFTFTSTPYWKDRHVTSQQVAPQSYIDNNNIDNKNGASAEEEIYASSSDSSESLRELSTISDKIHVGKIKSSRDKISNAKVPGCGIKRREGMRVSFADVRDEDTDTNRHDQSSNQKRWEKNLLKWPDRSMKDEPIRHDGGATPEPTLADIQDRFNKTREKLKLIIRKLDDPEWYKKWIQKQDEMDRRILAVNRKRLDLIRALAFTVEDASHRRSANLNPTDWRSVNDVEDRMRQRIHYQFAHHRFGTAARQPTRKLPDAVSLPHLSPEESRQYHHHLCDKAAQPVYTDRRAGCIACRIMKAARLYGCESRLATLSSRGRPLP